MSECEGRGGWVLVVDDDLDVRDAMEFVLATEHVVRTAGDGREALALIARHGVPCLVITDLQMPVMDGAGLIAALRGDPETAMLPIVACSASIGPVPGATAELSKLELDRVVDYVRAACAEKRRRLAEMRSE